MIVVLLGRLLVQVIYFIGFGIWNLVVTCRVISRIFCALIVFFSFSFHNTNHGFRFGYFLSDIIFLLNLSFLYGFRSVLISSWLFQKNFPSYFININTFWATSTLSVFPACHDKSLTTYRLTLIDNETFTTDHHRQQNKKITHILSHSTHEIFVFRFNHCQSPLLSYCSFWLHSGVHRRFVSTLYTCGTCKVIYVKSLVKRVLCDVLHTAYSAGFPICSIMWYHHMFMTWFHSPQSYRIKELHDVKKRMTKERKKNETKKKRPRKKEKKKKQKNALMRNNCRIWRSFVAIDSSMIPLVLLMITKQTLNQ